MTLRTLYSLSETATLSGCECTGHFCPGSVTKLKTLMRSFSNASL